MIQAVWNDVVIAVSDKTILIEGNHYFPPAHVLAECVRPSEHHTFCGWKGEASYYDVIVGDQINENAAWFYPHPKPAAAEIQDYLAFWKGVRVA